MFAAAVFQRSRLASNGLGSIAAVASLSVILRKQVKLVLGSASVGHDLAPLVR